MIVYEDLVADYEETIRRTLRFLQIPEADHVPIAATKMKSQTDNTTDQWLNQYLAFKKSNAGQKRREPAGPDRRR